MRELMQVMQVLECSCRLVKTTDLEVSDAAHRILDHKQRGEQLKPSRRRLRDRWQLLDTEEMIAVLAAGR